MMSWNIIMVMAKESCKMGKAKIYAGAVETGKKFTLQQLRMGENIYKDLKKKTQKLLVSQGTRIKLIPSEVTMRNKKEVNVTYRTLNLPTNKISIALKEEIEKAQETSQEEILFYIR